MNENTPSTAHITVLCGEAVDSLAVKPDGVYVDATFGRGGHSREILSRLGPHGRLIAIDRDVAAINSNLINDARFKLVHAAMSNLGHVVRQTGVEAVDGVLADLGVSSPQLDEAGRGFSFRLDAPLDMRMDQSRGVTAADWLASADQSELEKVISHYGEERFAKNIARKIVEARGDRPIRTTGELARVVAQAVRTREPGQHPATRTFQAVRIFINQELEEIEAFLPQAVTQLRAGGRLVVISFHSLEDRLVKRFIADAARADRLPVKLPVRHDEVDEATLKPLGRAIRPSTAEVEDNPRARSAIMRVAERTSVGALTRRQP